MLMPTESLPESSVRRVPHALDRRSEIRSSLNADLWMIDHHGATVLRCHCLDVSENGMRLRVPLGYGVCEGQEYELRSHLPGCTPTFAFNAFSQRWATVVRTQIHVGGDEDFLEIGVALRDHKCDDSGWAATPAFA